ncbi:furin-like protease 2 [Macrosteles quadrilineatus]|uniref:furin-like protease 2 n=1 Tax=Macrosteles quadrilineatus TaxID=74068 RepID=UPI0023E195D4|nr:furin-like protease 2 [Macrosteles quadrilineatus]
MKCLASASLCFLFTNLIVFANGRIQPVYLNQFAVFVPSGESDASEIASKHGFDLIGQISSLKGYYLLEHSRIRKRSLIHSEEHHEKLSNEEKVKWFQQQHEKKRVKRDFSDPNFPGFGDFQNLFPPASVQQLGSQHHNRYRGIGAQNIFPDPLFKEQWYLNGGAKDGYDMNISPAWQKGYTGKGVVVSILDDGIQTNHPDLAFNYDSEASTDINDNDNDPMPRDNGDNKHGTRCAGEVAAVAFNNYCGIGVAFNASIGGVRMLDGTVNDAVEARALGLNPDHVDIYSASWGPEDDGKTVDGPGPLARRAFINGVTSGRRGKGSIFVWASGNGGRHTDSCNCDGYTNSIFTLSISSATQGGFKPWYLEECSSTLATTYSSGTPGHDKSIASVDMDGKLRPDHICTVEHTGTSASAPLAAGMCALALEANPSLTWRDMQYLVVLTSKPGPLEKESGWIVNGVKRKVSHKFGYGLMDGGALVTLAEQWTTVPSQHICKSQEINEERQIEPSYGSALTVSMDVNACIGTLNEVRFLEHVQCKITLRFFPRGNLRLLLTSPMGTTSTLLFERPRDVVSSNFDDWPFLSVHFWGEKVEGRWTLQIINAGNRHVNQPGILRKWQLIFYGTAVNPIRLRSSQGSPLAHASETFAASFPSSAPANIYGGGDIFSSFSNLPNIFSVAGSEPEASIATMNGNKPPEFEDGGAMEGRKILHTCDPECDSQGCYGKGPTQCVACQHYKLDNTCVSRCPPRSYPNQAAVCWPCHESCETCAGPGQDSCLTCAPAHFRVTDLAVCLRQCPEGYIENSDEGTCVPCEANCASCQDRPDHCTSCEHHLVMFENKCYAACPMYTFETDDYRCMPCHSTCETCRGPSDSECITCRSGRLSLGGICYSVCPDGYFTDKKRKECMKCPTGCSTCNSATCLSCEVGYTLNKKGKCVLEGSSQCGPSQFYSGTHCESCHDSCDSCHGAASNNCLSCSGQLLLERSSCVGGCSAGYYPEQSQCVQCLHTCSQCVSRINCTTCKPGLQLQSGECRATCAQGYYSDLGVCAKCYLSCMTCSGPRRDQCVSCPLGWQLAGGECHPECPEGFFMSNYGCQKCHHYCRTCKGEGPLECTSCPPHSMLDGGLCMECLSSQYYDPPTQMCKPCHAACRSCSGPGPFSCTSCTYPLHLDTLNNQCVPCCTETTTQDCCSCDKDTGECHNASPAGKRRITSEQAERANTEQLEAMRLQAAQRYSAFLPITAVAVSICVAVVVVFTLVFVILQVRSRNSQRLGYSKVPLHRYTSTPPEVTREFASDDEVLFTKT